MEYLRVWTEVDIGEIENKIIIVDDKFGYCPGCKEIGIKLEGVKRCPKCSREFAYVTSREASGGKSFDIVLRTRKKLPDLTFVDFDDYERVMGKKKAQSLFKGI